MTKFYQMTPEQRLDKLKKERIISNKHFNILKECLKPEQIELCNKLSENVISGMFLPLAIIPKVFINNKEYNIPMVTEESSVVAAVNKISSMILQSGSIKINSSKNIGTGQIYFPELKDPDDFTRKVGKNKNIWRDLMHNSCLKSMFNRGGGIIDIKPILHKRQGSIHFYIDTCDAMGANIINQTLESISETVSYDLSETIGIKILSNLTDQALTKAQLKLALDQEQASKIIEANNFAQVDIYRACTHNKGIMNGINAVLMATGNDCRAVSAAIHTFAAKDSYSSLTKWNYKDGMLIGELELPINVGICGGITKIHPITKTCLEISNVNSAPELAGLCAATGLMQNLAALLALTSEGICKGHMSLHINNIISELNCNIDETKALRQELEDELSAGAHITTSIAEKLLIKIRQSG